jgi:hypothetical protein
MISAQTRGPVAAEATKPQGVFNQTGRLGHGAQTPRWGRVSPPQSEGRGRPVRRRTGGRAAPFLKSRASPAARPDDRGIAR